ncbi:unnamed protein product [Ceratitis capitata]|uniref:(Mediterranean fruit fly) hypothetical protein n=1 Tax=Ceratitis capitata TaxID=7213 RepID=A0A811VE43_CERCA|nr:unnamed protein product [Ceratitis capitata]
MFFRTHCNMHNSFSAAANRNLMFHIVVCVFTRYGEFCACSELQLPNDGSQLRCGNQMKEAYELRSNGNNAISERITVAD